MAIFTIGGLRKIISDDTFKELIKEMNEVIVKCFNSLSNDELLDALQKVYKLSYKESGDTFWANYLTIQKNIIEILNKRGIEIPPNPYKQ